MTRIFHWFLCERWIPCQASTFVLCLHYRPETVQCSTKDAHLWNNFPCIITLIRTKILVLCVVCMYTVHCTRCVVFMLCHCSIFKEKVPQGSFIKVFLKSHSNNNGISVGSIRYFIQEKYTQLLKKFPWNYSI